MSPIRTEQVSHRHNLSPALYYKILLLDHGVGSEDLGCVWCAGNTLSLLTTHFSAQILSCFMCTISLIFPGYQQRSLSLVSSVRSQRVAGKTACLCQSKPYAMIVSHGREGLATLKVTSVIAVR
jgi:hypothetical protein